LEKYGFLWAMMDKPLEELTQIRGIKAIRAIRIAAAFELARRLLEQLEPES